MSFFKDWNNHKSIALSMLVGTVILIIIITANLTIDVKSITMNLDIAGQGPSLAHPFGVDWIGRDMFLRTMKGLGGSLRVGLLAAILSIFIALCLAVISASLWSGFDHIIGIATDTCLGVPHIVIMVVISAALGGGEVGVVTAVATTHWTSLTRILRAEILQLREEHYIKQSKNLGKSNFYIVRYHMLLHLLPQIIVRFILLFPHVILHEAAITFLGFGLSPLHPAIGVILSESIDYIATGMWWLVFFPGAALLIMVMCFESLGDGLNKILSPETSRN